MEPGVAAFSIFLVFCWLVLIVVIGLTFNPAFIYKQISAANVVLYV